jgi:pimeloyl-ACP methyl ester carboxylesterase
MRLAPLLLLTSCVTLDFLSFNPVHCTNVTESTCSDGEVFDRVCLTCDEPYQWDVDYPFEAFFPGMLGNTTIRPIDAATVQPFRIETDDGEGTLDAYFIPAHGDVPSLAQTTVVFNHGNYASIEHYMPRVRILHEWGVNVFVWDYRGYGKSLPDSAPSASQFVADAKQVYEVAEGVAPDPSRMIVYANSLGGIPAAEQAVSFDVCAAIFEAAFTSIRRIGQDSTGVTFGDSLLTEGLFDNEARLKGYARPLFAMIGDEDRRFDWRDWERIVDNAAGPKDLWVLPGVDHGIATRGVPEAGVEAYFRRLDEFLSLQGQACLSL